MKTLGDFIFGAMSELTKQDKDTCLYCQIGKPLPGIRFCSNWCEVQFIGRGMSELGYQFGENKDDTSE